MNFEHIPTPETEAVNAQGKGYATRFYTMKTHARDLERRLTVAREALAKVVKAWDYAEWLNENDFEAFRETLTQTAPKP